MRTIFLVAPGLKENCARQLLLQMPESETCMRSCGCGLDGKMVPQMHIPEAKAGEDAQRRFPRVSTFIAKPSQAL